MLVVELVQAEGKGVGERKFNTPKFVDTFYNLITDFYEYGWYAATTL